MKPLIKLPITIGTVPLYSTYRCVHFEDSIESNHIGKYSIFYASIEIIIFQLLYSDIY